MKKQFILSTLIAVLLTVSAFAQDRAPGGRSGSRTNTSTVTTTNSNGLRAVNALADFRPTAGISDTLYVEQRIIILDRCRVKFYRHWIGQNTWEIEEQVFNLGDLNANIQPKFVEANGLLKSFWHVSVYTIQDNKVSISETKYTDKSFTQTLGSPTTKNANAAFIYFGNSEAANQFNRAITDAAVQCGAR